MMTPRARSCREMPPPRSWIRAKRSVLVAGAVLMAVAQALFIGLKLPGPRRSRTAGQADWLSEVKRIHPKTVWGKSGIDSLLGPKPQPCPYKLLAYHDWAGACVRAIKCSCTWIVQTRSLAPHTYAMNTDDGGLATQHLHHGQERKPIM